MPDGSIAEEIVHQLYAVDGGDKVGLEAAFNDLVGLSIRIFAQPAGIFLFGQRFRLVVPCKQAGIKFRCAPAQGRHFTFIQVQAIDHHHLIPVFHAPFDVFFTLGAHDDAPADGADQHAGFGIIVAVGIGAAVKADFAVPGHLYAALAVLEEHFYVDIFPVFAGFCIFDGVHQAVRYGQRDEAGHGHADIAQDFARLALFDHHGEEIAYVGHAEQRQDDARAHFHRAAADFARHQQHCKKDVQKQRRLRKRGNHEFEHAVFAVDDGIGQLDGDVEREEDFKYHHERIEGKVRQRHDGCGDGNLRSGLDRHAFGNAATLEKRDQHIIDAPQRQHRRRGIRHNVQNHRVIGYRDGTDAQQAAGVDQRPDQAEKHVKHG